MRYEKTYPVYVETERVNTHRRITKVWSPDFRLYDRAPNIPVDFLTRLPSDQIELFDAISIQPLLQEILTQEIANRMAARFIPPEPSNPIHHPHSSDTNFISLSITVTYDVPRGFFTITLPLIGKGSNVITTFVTGFVIYLTLRLTLKAIFEGDMNGAGKILASSLGSFIQFLFSLINYFYSGGTLVLSATGKTLDDWIKKHRHPPDYALSQITPAAKYFFHAMQIVLYIFAFINVFVNATFFSNQISSTIENAVKEGISSFPLTHIDTFARTFAAISTIAAVAFLIGFAKLPLEDIKNILSKWAPKNVMATERTYLLSRNRENQRHQSPQPSPTSASSIASSISSYETAIMVATSDDSLLEDPLGATASHNARRGTRGTSTLSLRSGAPSPYLRGTPTSPVPYTG